MMSDSVGKSNTAKEKNQRVMAMGLSVSISTLLMVLKFYTYWLTDSTAVLSDALESIINVVASSFALWSVILAAKPPDLSHPYGHGKVEFFSAGFEGALIILASGGIIWEAFPEIWQPKSLPNLDSGLLILFGTGIVNLVLGWSLMRTGKRTRSLAIAADGKHIITDVYTSAGVLLGLVLVRQTGWYWLDGAMACLVAVNILFIGIKLIRESSSRLMDASDPALLDQITGVINKNRKDSWIDIHHLRAWRSGERIHVDFHIILPRELSLEKAHQEVTLIEHMLKENVPGLGDALIHAEPCIAPECPICGLDPCKIRKEPATQLSLWNRDTVATLAGSENRNPKVVGRRRSKLVRRFSRAIN
jgi:cation diffusion facilitator family transporter